MTLAIGGLRCERREEVRRAGGDLLAVAIVGAADLHEGVARLLHLGHDHRVRDRGGEVVLHLAALIGEALRGGELGGEICAVEFLQLLLLLLAALLRGNGEQLQLRGPAQRRDIGCGQRARVDAQIIDAPGEWRARLPPTPDGKGLRDHGGAGERVDLHRRLFEHAVHEHPHARRLPRSVVAHREMQEFIRRQIAFALHMDRVAWPLVDEVEAGPRAVEFHIPPARVAAALHPAKGRAALGLEPQPGGDGECLAALEPEAVAVFQPARALGAVAAAHRALDECAGTLRGGGDLCARVAHASAVGIEGEARPRPSRLGGTLREGLLPLRLPRIEPLRQLALGEVGVVEFRVELREPLRLLRARHGEEGLRIPVTHAVLAALRHVVEEGVELVEIALRHGIVFVVVALRARERQAEPGRAGRGHAIDHIEVQVFLIDQPALVARHHVAVKAGRDLLIDRRSRQEIARELLDAEVAERLVRVERPDDPLAPKPHVAQRVIVVTRRVAVTREVEPRQREPLAEMRRGEQTVGGIADCGLWIADCFRDEGVHFRGSRRQAGEIERHPANELLRFRDAGRREPLREQTIQDKAIDRILRPPLQRPLLPAKFRPARSIALLPIRNPQSGIRNPPLLRFHGCHKRPVPRPLRPIPDPPRQQRHLLGRELLVLLGRRHHVVLVRGGDAPHQLAAVGIAGDDRHLARLRLAEGRLPLIEPQPGLALRRIRPVAGEAVVGENRPHLPRKVDLPARLDGERGDGEEQGETHGANGRNPQCGKP